jgi:hypothetical protein
MLRRQQALDGSWCMGEENERNAFVAKFKAKFEKFKVRSFCFCVFCNLLKLNFFRFCFVEFSIRWLRL